MERLERLDDSRLADYRLLAEPAALREAGLFVAEGRLVVRRLLETPDITTRSVLVTPAAWQEMADVLAPAAPRIPVYVVPQAVMNDVAGFNIHRGCLGVGTRPEVRRLADLAIDRMARLLVLEGINNPDNVGGLFRSAAAFGVDAVVLGPECGDPLYRKAVRTSMGAVLSVPFVDAGAWPGGLAELRAAGYQVLALTPAPEAGELEDYSRSIPKVALLAGAEGHGLSAGAQALATARVRIPMSHRVDSLNVTTAASIALHHFFQ